jgi:ferritin-like metal-binding protein YciE
MQITSFRDLYVVELQELRSMKALRGETLQWMSDAASSSALKSEFARHRQETLAQKERLDQILERHSAAADAHTDQAMQALATETRKMCGLIQDGELRDAALIDSAQRVAHYEIAAFGTAAALAGQLGLRDEQTVLHLFTEEEKRADAAMTALARNSINPKAAAAA